GLTDRSKIAVAKQFRTGFKTRHALSVPTPLLLGNGTNSAWACTSCAHQLHKFQGQFVGGLLGHA
ncbi:MAG: hypothetical protein ABL927_12430, partial [Bdellovibrionales bacterium]